MSSEMNANRFASLAEAYGGDIRRWPEAERAAAWAFAKVEPAAAEPVLDAARRIDLALNAGPGFHPSPALRELVLASAPRAQPRMAWGGWAPRWLAPAGFAAACVAGAWLGVAASHGAQAQLRADTVLVASADLTAGDPEDPGSL
jgi:hypothetical protein